jgi:hypothetical protein
VGLEGSSDVLEEEGEVEFVGGAGFELGNEVAVEGACNLGLGVYEQRITFRIDNNRSGT